MARFLKKMGIELTHVPYKSTAQSIIDVASGLIQVQLASIPPAMSLYTGGLVRVLAVAGPRRIPLMPDVPTMREAGVKDFEATFWLGMFAPAHTPTVIVNKLNAEIAATMNDPKVQQALAKQGVEAESSSSLELRKIVSAEITEFRETVHDLGIRAE